MADQSPKLSEVQRYWLIDLAKRPGATKKFTSGWPTWDVLERHGLIETKSVLGTYGQYTATVTDAGWSYLVPLGIRQRPEETA